MFWFRNRVEQAARQEGGAPCVHDEPSVFLAPPLPEVVEGNGEADWALWEASVAAMEERMHAMAAEPPDSSADFATTH
jgi:hypothetical protein